MHSALVAPGALKPRDRTRLLYISSCAITPRRNGLIHNLLRSVDPCAGIQITARSHAC